MEILALKANYMRDRIDSPPPPQKKTKLLTLSYKQMRGEAAQDWIRVNLLSIFYVFQ